MVKSGYSESDCDVISNQEEAIRDLVDLLSEGRAILVVGAGSSKFAGYPLFDELLDELIREFAPSLEKPSCSYSRSEFADLIKKEVEENERTLEFEKYLESRFDPDHQTIDEFHCALVHLGFKGIVTTNYDAVLENAISNVQAREQEVYYRSSDSINLCDERKSYRVSKFLRALSTKTNLNSVLHIHGYYKDPEKIILTEKDYLKYYGNRDNAGERTHVPLDTLHRKVIWALLTMYSAVFVGFNISEDPFILKMLDIIKNDLKLHGECLHYAILSSEDITHKELLKKYCVQPIFYYVPEKDDHSELRNLIFDLENSVIRVAETEVAETEVAETEVAETKSSEMEPIGSLSLDEINKRMLGI